MNWEGNEGEAVVIRGVDAQCPWWCCRSFRARFFNRSSRTYVSKTERQHLIMLGCVVAASVWFHANLSFSAMIPRAIRRSGGLADRIVPAVLRRLMFRGTGGCTTQTVVVGLDGLVVVLGRHVEGFVVTLVLWVLFWSTCAMTGGAKNSNKVDHRPCCCCGGRPFAVH